MGQNPLLESEVVVRLQIVLDPHEGLDVRVDLERKAHDGLRRPEA